MACQCRFASGQCFMRLLLVEDDQVMSAVLASGLRDRAYAVDIVGDGDAAVYQAAINPYDAIVLAAAGLVTDALKQQLKVGGRIVAPETQRDGRQLLKVFEKRVAGFIEKTYEEVKFVPLLPGVVAA